MKASGHQPHGGIDPASKIPAATARTEGRPMNPRRPPVPASGATAVDSAGASSASSGVGGSDISGRVWPTAAPRWQSHAGQVSERRVGHVTPSEATASSAERTHAGIPTPRTAMPATRTGVVASDASTAAMRSR